MSILYGQQASFDVFVFHDAAGKQRSQTGAAITLLPHVASHNVDQKLLIHQTFSDGHPSSVKSLIQVVGSHRYVKPQVFAECVIDLVHLFDIKSKGAISFPLDTRLDPNASLTFSVMVTNFSFSGSFSKSPLSSVLEDSVVASSTLSSIAESVLEYQGLNASTADTGVRSHGLRRLESADIYRTINKMATKLSRIENDIQRKTLKLNKINRKNLDEVNGLRSRLEDQIALKDQQIRILTTQLDEMHTALALSHERELELGGFVLGRREFSGNDAMEFREGGMSKVGAFPESASVRYDFNRNESVTPASVRGSERHFTKHSGGEELFTNKDRDNLSLLQKQRLTPSWHTCDNGDILNNSVPHLGERPTERWVTIFAGTQVTKCGYGDTAFAGRRHSNERVAKQVVPLSWVRGKISSELNAPRGIMRTASATPPMKAVLPYVHRASADPKSPKHITSIQHSSGREIHASNTRLTHELRTPGTTVLPLGKIPALIHRNLGARLPQEAGGVMPDLPRSIVRPLAPSVSGATAPVASTPSSQLSVVAPAETKSRNSPVSDVNDDRDTTIVRLERDLITTKVALADSETQRDIEIAKILTTAAHT
ncbi:oligodendrocyte transcription factor 2-like protein, putative [Babesia ovata]|uniref:Oligodendrocyte transcription factor 2-like protein, putative n=1 Tax=Babesia ovata TaxID=189622 RepID=A0A2H6KE98_9APIC|nr:oligodendrocyte transcription factor 2-like protein, putative [Babesia ovata]GBE61279.1 oligodendrocyte transcription factor 2-like protein, putative [Babesia ovata]